MFLVDPNRKRTGRFKHDKKRQLSKRSNDTSFLLAIYAGLGFILFHALHAWYHIAGENVPTSHGPRGIQYALAIGLMVAIVVYYSLKRTKGVSRIFLLAVVFILENVSSWVLITKSTFVVILNLCIAGIVISAVLIRSNYRDRIERLKTKRGLLSLLHDEILSMINVFIQIIGLVLIGGFIPVGIYLWSVIPEGNRIYETTVVVFAWIYVTIGASWFIVIESLRALRGIQSRYR